MTQEELSKTIGVAESTIRTNFPKVCVSQLKKGILLTRKGHYPNAEYFIEKVEPETRDKSEFSETRKRTVEELPNEKWITCCVDVDYEVSNLGRFRNKQSKIIYEGTIANSGYQKVFIHSRPFLLHRLIMQSFNPIKNPDTWTVDHINGIRTENRLENLRWASGEENTLFMMQNRAELNKELTRIINKMGYEKTLETLRSL